MARSGSTRIIMSRLADEQWAKPRAVNGRAALATIECCAVLQGGHVARILFDCVGKETDNTP